MNKRAIFDTISVMAAGAVVAEQAIEILGPFFRGVSVKAPSFLPDIVRDIPTRTANAFAAFSTAPSEYASARPRMTRPAPMHPRPHRAPANDQRITQQKAARA